MKDLMIEMLELLQKNGEQVTRLLYRENGKIEYVENFSPFVNENYLTNGLREALSNSKTLTSNQENELKHFIIEKAYNGNIYEAIVKIQELRDQLDVKNAARGKGIIISGAEGDCILNHNGMDCKSGSITISQQNNIVWYIDSIFNKDGNYKFDIRIDALDVNKGEFKYMKRFIDLRNSSEVASKIINYIVQKRPNQVIFNTVGVSVAVYDSFVEKLKTYDIEMKENGVLAYSN
ncbi:hypothetical protein [uncultured Metabacillus sp.]|uniref:hypothetical protein n=1 Tax=uncultured Metabacillus sp. TaxID=2860135 RepID=UPI0026161B52|nr:hypothetical protein [uncultured Metabacillus sp.]